MTAVESVRSDEECVLAPSSPRRPARKVPQDWQPRLISLLAVLEHLRAELDGRRLGSDAEFVLVRIEAMVQSAEELAEQTPFPNELVAEQTDAIARAGNFMTAVSAVRTKRSGAIKAFWTTLSGGTVAPTAPGVREALHCAVEALNSYFSLFTSHFGSSTAAREWVDAASVFLAELRRLARELPN